MYVAAFASRDSLQLDCFSFYCKQTHLIYWLQNQLAIFEIRITFRVEANTLSRSRDVGFSRVYAHIFSPVSFCKDFF